MRRIRLSPELKNPSLPPNRVSRDLRSAQPRLNCPFRELIRAERVERRIGLTSQTVGGRCSYHICRTVASQISGGRTRGPQPRLTWDGLPIRPTNSGPTRARQARAGLTNNQIVKEEVRNLKDQ